MIYFYVYVPLEGGKYKRHTREEWVNLPLRDKVFGIFTTDKDLGDIYTVKRE